jgi:hypothetical protein
MNSYLLWPESGKMITIDRVGTGALARPAEQRSATEDTELTTVEECDQERTTRVATALAVLPTTNGHNQRRLVP